MHRTAWAMIELALEMKAAEAESTLSDAAFMPLPHFALAAEQAVEAWLLVGWWRSVEVVS